MSTKLFLAAVMSMAMFCGCKKDNVNTSPKYPADVANAWMQMQIRLTRTTPGYNSIVSSRSFGYAGVVMYESVLPAIGGASSLLAQIGGTAIVQDKNTNHCYWPASVNAAMASISRQFFENTTEANLSCLHSTRWPWIVDSHSSPFGPPILPHWASNRPFIPNSPTLTQPPPPAS